MNLDASAAAVVNAREEGGQLALREFDRETAEGLDFSDLTFRRVRFRRCQFLDCDFSAAAFYDCEFTSCAFLSCRLAGSFWKDSVLADCKAEGGDFRKARFKDCTLDGVSLSASCQELKGAKIHASQAAVVARVLGIEAVG